MGLAASQARLLTITSRKADCEFQSMTLSHQKLSLTRDMDRISNEYQNSLSATKLVYDYQSMGSREMNLTYGLLMSPSVYNDYYPKLVTDNKNRIILNSQYAAAARAAGIPAEGLLGTPSSDVRNKFIKALASGNVITPATAAQIEAVTYANDIGLGSTISTTASYKEMSYSELLNSIQANTEKYDYNLSYKGTFTRDDFHGGEYFSKYDANGGFIDQQDVGSAEISLYELLTSDTSYNIACSSDKYTCTPIIETEYLQNKIAGSGGILDWLVDEFTKVFGNDTQNQLAIQYAYNQLYDLIYLDSSVQSAANVFKSYETGKDNHDKISQISLPDNTVDGLDKNNKTIMDSVGSYVAISGGDQYVDTFGNRKPQQVAGKYLGFTYNAGSDSRSNVCTSVAINLNNLAKAFLTSYVEYSEGVDNSEYNLVKGNLSLSSLYDPKKNKDFQFNALDSTSINNNESNINASFYDAIFNMICTKGWVENAQIDDGDYMSEMLKNGMAFISSISDDGFYYQSTYSNEKNILEVTDNEAIAQAEAKYNSEKAKIENKEETLDLKMKNLDTEISSLNQEYETVKTLVTKQIEKSFKRYEA